MISMGIIAMAILRYSLNEKANRLSIGWLNDQKVLI
ncbi:hypothetical protein FHS68_005389 [Dyadobacter arcticus]|uniref:Uncharacterized protein n=1 Tax=Dyadobacter arcticus TaxID=1078754 RepID=A0ABX0UT94_9BACT|nr:hypothetical protein [Dyadobacter arcticus]